MSQEEKDPVFEYQFQVLESHLDTFGHMNHATYFVLFEQARWELITQRGYGLKEIFENQVGPTILEAEIKYKRELRLRENIRIETRFEEWKGKVGKVKQKMINENGEDCAKVELTFGVFDMKRRKLIDPPEAWLRAIGKPVKEKK